MFVSFITTGYLSAAEDNCVDYNIAKEITAIRRPVCNVFFCLHLNDIIASPDDVVGRYSEHLQKLSRRT